MYWGKIQFIYSLETTSPCHDPDFVRVQRMSTLDQLDGPDKHISLDTPGFLFPFDGLSGNCAFNGLIVLIFPFFLQYGAEFRRFSVDRVKPGKFEEFYKLILHIHRIANMEVMIGYADIHGDLLPINNDDNFCKAVSTAHPLLRIFIQRQGRISERRHAYFRLPLTYLLFAFFKTSTASSNIVS